MPGDLPLLHYIVPAGRRHDENPSRLNGGFPLYLLGAVLTTDFMVIHNTIHFCSVQLQVNIRIIKKIDILFLEPVCSLVGPS